MDQRKRVFSTWGVILFILGILTGLALCGWYVWGEIEASLLVFRTGDRNIHLSCPLLLNGGEEGTISAVFSNPTGETIHPTVRAVISRTPGTRTDSTVLTLEPGQRQTVKWRVGPGDRIFGGVIVVNVYESPQRNFLSGQGSCGIMDIPFLPFSGKEGSAVIILLSLATIVVGCGLWVKGNNPIRGRAASISQAGVTLATSIFLSIGFMLLRWWVFSGFFSLGVILIGGIMFTQFGLFPHDDK